MLHSLCKAHIALPLLLFLFKPSSKSHSQSLFHLLLHFPQLSPTFHLNTLFIHRHSNSRLTHIIRNILIKWQINQIHSILLKLGTHYPHHLIPQRDILIQHTIETHISSSNNRHCSAVWHLDSKRSKELVIGNCTTFKIDLSEGIEVVDCPVFAAPKNLFVAHEDNSGVSRGGDLKWFSDLIFFNQWDGFGFPNVIEVLVTKLSVLVCPPWIYFLAEGSTNYVAITTWKIKNFLFFDFAIKFQNVHYLHLYKVLVHHLVDIKLLK